MYKEKHDDLFYGFMEIIKEIMKYLCYAFDRVNQTEPINMNQNTSSLYPLFFYQ